MDRTTEDPEPERAEETAPTHGQQAAEAAQAESEPAYNDPIGGMPIA